MNLIKVSDSKMEEVANLIEAADRKRRFLTEYWASSRLKPRWKEGMLKGLGGLCCRYRDSNSEQRGSL